jgi:hypothetical protein
LTVSLPEDVKVGDILNYKSIISDETQLRSFESQFSVKVQEEQKSDNGGGNGGRVKPPSDENGDKRASSLSLALPQVIEVHFDDWPSHQFDQFSALDVKDTGESGYDFYINMDNTNLLTEIKARKDVEIKLLQDRYKYAMVLIGMALLKENSQKDSQNGPNEVDMLKEIRDTTGKLSLVILPIISYLGELEVQS